MKIGWGWKIAGLYISFMAMIVCLVAASSHQKIDLVSKDYYTQEIKYQEVLDASHNQSALSGSLSIHATGSEVVLEFPADFKGRIVTGEVNFYAPSNNQWDRTFAIHTEDNVMTVSRAGLHKSNYRVRVSYAVDGKKYYYESRLDLNAS